MQRSASMLRMLLVGIFLVIYLIFSIPVLIIESIIRKINKRAADISSLRIVGWGFKCISVLSGVKLTVTGEENVPKDRPVLYIANHLSFFDVILTYSRVPDLTCYISKESIFKVPVLGEWMKRLYCLSLDRSDTRQGLKVILTAIDYIKEGISVFIFPEGTRSKDGTLGEFHAGSFKVATKTGCPIIPVAIKGTSAVLEDHLPLIKSSAVSITYGEPIDPAALTPDEKKHIADYTRNRIADMLAASPIK